MTDLQEQLKTLEAKLNQMDEELQAAILRIADLEGRGTLLGEEKGLLPREYEIPGFKRGSTVTVFRAMDNREYLDKGEAIQYLGLSRTTGFDLFDRWEHAGKLTTESFVGKSRYILRTKLDEIKKDLYSPKSKDLSSDELIERSTE